MGRYREPDTSRSYLRDIRVGGKDTAVVFVHGVFGDGELTFKSPRSEYSWPDLVTQDPLFRDTDVYVYGYASDWTAANLDIQQLGGDMHVRVGDVVNRHKNVIFVCHSMGGLVVRSYITQYAAEARDRIAFLYFFSTPTSGADIARVGRQFLPNTQLGNMSPATGDALLRDLETRWLSAGYGLTLHSYCAYETVAMPIVGIIVPWASAVGLCNAGVLAIEANHLGIVKPANVEAKPHIALRTAYQDWLRSDRVTPARLIPATDFEMAFLPDERRLTLAFRGVTSSTTGGDVIVDAYATIQQRDGQSDVPFGSNEVSCVSGSQNLAIPFVFGNRELACRLEKTLGDISYARFTSVGERRVSITFETSDRRGFTAQYCYTFDDDDLAELSRGNFTRRFLYALCPQ